MKNLVQQATAVKFKVTRAAKKFWDGKLLEGVDFWIPYEVDPNMEVEFSHKDYSGLYFRSTPYEFQVWRAFYQTLQSRTSRHIQFVDGLAQQTKSSKERLDFYHNLLKLMKSNQRDDRFFEWILPERLRSLKESVITHANLQIEIETKREADNKVKYPIKRVRGAITALLEVALMIYQHAKFEKAPKSEEAFVKDFLLTNFGIRVSSYGTIRGRIRDRGANSSIAQTFADSLEADRLHKQRLRNRKS